MNCYNSHEREVISTCPFPSRHTVDGRNPVDMANIIPFLERF